MRFGQENIVVEREAPKRRIEETVVFETPVKAGETATPDRPKTSTSREFLVDPQSGAEVEVEPGTNIPKKKFGMGTILLLAGLGVGAFLMLKQ